MKLHSMVPKLRASVDKLDSLVSRFENAAQSLGRRSNIVLPTKPFKFGRYLTARHAAAFAACSQSFVRARARQGIIGQYGTSRKRLYSRKEIDNAIREFRWGSKGAPMKKISRRQ